MKHPATWSLCLMGPVCQPCGLYSLHVRRYYDY